MNGKLVFILFEGENPAYLEKNEQCRKEEYNYIKRFDYFYERHN